MKIAILGAGGLGCLIGASLHEAGHAVTLVARGEHLRALTEGGLRLVEQGQVRTLMIPSFTADEIATRSPASGGFDLAFVTVKAHALGGIAPLAGPLTRAGTWVVPLVNGVDARERLVNAGVEAHRVTPGVAYLTGFRTRPGTVERQGTHQRLVFESLDGLADQAHPAAAAFANTSIEAKIVQDVRIELWRKMAVVCALSAVCGGVGVPIGFIRQDPFGLDLQRRAVGEVFAVARALGIPLTDQDESAVLETLDAFDDTLFPSLLHDLRRGQPTEVEALNGTVSRLGRETGVPTPCHDFASTAIRAAESAKSGS